MLLLCLCFLTGVAGSPSLSARVLSVLDSEIEKVVQCHGLAGLSLTVVKDGKTLLHRGYGYSDLASLSPVTPDTLYAIGSVSKQFTSFLLEYYQEHGLIDLELPLAPQLAGADQTFRITSGPENNEISAQDLLSHRTGLPDYMGLEFLGSRTRAQLFQDLFYSDQDSKEEYRGSWKYNNWLYVAAARAGEIMSGHTFEHDLQRVVFDNLGMGAGTLSDPGFVKRNLHRIAKPYLYQLGENTLVEDEMWLNSSNPSMNPAGGLVASGRDMARWMNFLLDRGILNARRRLVRPRTIDNMFNKLSELSDWPRTFSHWSSYCVGYGEGWFLFSCPLDHNSTEYSHSGNFYNVHYSKINLYPEHKIGVFFAFSGGRSSLNRNLFDVLDVIILDLLLHGKLNPRISMAVNSELKQWDNPTNDSPAQIGGDVSNQDNTLELSKSSVSNIHFADKVLNASYLGVFRHPFLGKAELLYDNEQTPRLVLNDRWISRVLYVVEAEDGSSANNRDAGLKEHLLTLHCFFDNIPWLPNDFRDDESNKMLITIERPTSDHSKVETLTIQKWLGHKHKGVTFTRVKD